MNEGKSQTSDKSKSAGSGGAAEVFQGYELLQALEAGGMAEAYKARKIDTGKIVFLKRVRVRSKKDKNALEREMQVYNRLMMMQNQHVLQVLDVVRDENYTGFVTEFAEGGDLDSYVRKHDGGNGLPPGEAKAIGVEVIAALQELHSHDIVHRDLKPRNVLSTHGEWKLTDFGISKNLSRLVTQKTFQQFGTLGYTAPEQFEGVTAHPSADIYSFGKVLIFLLTAQTDIDHVSYPSWRGLILRCVQTESMQRPSTEVVLESLRAIVT
jgi:serine/threonine protein kinase